MSKKIYEAFPGVEWVNGKPVPKSREIELSETEAGFDLAQGRIQAKKVAPAQAAKSDAEKIVADTGKAKG